MELIFPERAWDDYPPWQANDPKLLLRINRLIRECLRTPLAAQVSPNRCAARAQAGGRGVSRKRTD